VVYAIINRQRQEVDPSRWSRGGRDEYDRITMDDHGTARLFGELPVSKEAFCR
jgi:hypothetical protein